MKIVAAILGAASHVALAGTGSEAQEAYAQPLGLASGGIAATTVAFGCGPGFMPNRFGVCRPRFGGYGYGRFGYGRPYGYGFRGYGHRRYGYY